MPCHALTRRIQPHSPNVVKRVTFWLVVTRAREHKTRRIMNALERGIPGGKICLGEAPIGRAPVVIWGQEWDALRVIPRAVAEGRPWWNIDNGFIWPAGGTARGYYRLTYRSMSPILLRDPEQRPDLGVTMQPWRRGGRHV